MSDIFLEHTEIDSPAYPNKLKSVETTMVSERRRKAEVDFAHHRIGMALSGGGIRSATFCLGILQSLASKRMLRRIDFLSTVSGGGFIGSFLGKWIQNHGIDRTENRLPDNNSWTIRYLRDNGRYIAPNGAGDLWVAAAAYLRGWLAILFTLGVFVLCFTAFFAAVERAGLILAKGLPNPNILIRSIDEGACISPWWIGCYAWVALFVLPLGIVFWLIGSQPWRPTWIVWGFGLLLVGLLIWQWREGTVVVSKSTIFSGLLGMSLILISGVLFGRSHKTANKLRYKTLATVVVLLSYFCFCNFHLTWPWDRHIFAISDVGLQVILSKAQLRSVAGLDLIIWWFSGWLLGLLWILSFIACAVANELDFVRRKLTEYLAFCLLVTAGLVVLAVVDTAALYATTIKSLSWSRVVGGGAAASALWAAVKWALPMLASRKDGNVRIPVSLDLLASIAAAILAFSILSTLRLFVYRFAGELHTPLPPFLGFQHLLRDTTIHTLLIWTAILFAISFFVGRTETFLNLSSDLQVYTARLTRAYLGATNERRENNVLESSVTKPVAGDDVFFTEYHPERKGGPLHIINTTVNETVLGRSQLEQKDRHGFPMALGPAGISVSKTSHALFTESDTLIAKFQRAIKLGEHAVQDAASKVIASVRHQAHEKTGTESQRPRVVSKSTSKAKILRVGSSGYPLLDRTENSPAKPRWIEMLTLGQWVGISGAAFSTGLGERTSIGLSFLAGSFNIRLGYWWDSKVYPWTRMGFMNYGLLEMLGIVGTGIFPAQSFLLDEFLARFHGPSARRLWYLSDGGHFENTAVYELIRRRVAFIMVCDCGADPDYQFEDIGGLVRKARIDFGAEITFLSRSQLDGTLAKDIAPIFAPPADFKKDKDGHSQYCAALARIAYKDGQSPDGSLLVLKPALIGGEPADIHNYQLLHPAFPQESTLEQFFNEAQWESYRKLGQWIADRVFQDVSMTKKVPIGGCWVPASLTPV
jgi:hypothetical protein